VKKSSRVEKLNGSKVLAIEINFPLNFEILNKEQL
jgi:hypothetical protein